MTKREWLIKMQAVPLDAVIVDDTGKPFKSILYSIPGNDGHLRTAMMTTRDIGEIEINSYPINLISQTYYVKTPSG